MWGRRRRAHAGILPVLRAAEPSDRGYAADRRPAVEKCARVPAGPISLFSHARGLKLSWKPMDQELRIGRLERDVRRMRLAVVCVSGLCATFALSAFTERADQVVRAEAVELLDAGGVRQARLSADATGFLLTLLDASGRPEGSLRLTAEPRLSVETGRGNEVAGLGFPKVRNLKE
jgi:hypothetical protein